MAMFCPLEYTVGRGRVPDCSSVVKSPNRFLKVSGAVSGFHPGGGRDIFRGWRKSPRGWRKKCSGTSFPSAFFCFPTHYITNLRPLFYILDSCYKEIHKISIFLFFFLFVFLYFIRKFGSPQRSRFRGVETP